MDAKERQDVAYFLSFCIEQYKVAKGLTGREAAHVLNDYGVLEYNLQHPQRRAGKNEALSLLRQEITQDNIHLILPCKVCRIADLVCQDGKVDLIQAIMKVYDSQTYERLAIEETKEWHLGPVDLLSDLRAESKKSVN